MSGMYSHSIDCRHTRLRKFLWMNSSAKQVMLVHEKQWKIKILLVVQLCAGVSVLVSDWTGT